MNVPSTPRTDLVFLRRRLKPGRAQPASTTAAAPQQSVPQERPQQERVPQQSAQSAQSLTLRPAATAPSSPASTSPASTRPASARQAPPVDQAGAPRSSGLVLGRSAAASTARVSPTAPSRSTASSAAPARASSTGARAQTLAARREKATLEDREVQLLFPAPGIEELYELNFVDRVLRLSAVQSAVGTLVVSGSTAIAWENVRGVTGGQTVDGHKAGTPVTTAGNRDLVGYHGREALVSLRHVREMRRAIFINRSSAPLGVQLFSGDTVALPPAADGTQMVLLVHRIGNVLELRAEPVPLDWPDVKIWQEFDFSMTHKAPATAYGL